MSLQSPIANGGQFANPICRIAIDDIACLWIIATWWHFDSRDDIIFNFHCNDSSSRISGNFNFILKTIHRDNVMVLDKMAN